MRDQGLGQHATSTPPPPPTADAARGVGSPHQIYHPNINLDGKVCLNILREDWKPVLDLSAVIYGIIYLFYEPNPDDPLNHGAPRAARVVRASAPHSSPSPAALEQRPRTCTGAT